MKPDYRNWVPKGMIQGFAFGAVLSAVLFLAVYMTEFLTGALKIAALIVLGLLCIGLIAATGFFINLYRTFSYDGKVKLAKRIIDKVSDYVIIPAGGVGLDVGCGSGALTIACAKKNPRSRMVGLDRWGKEYASYNKPLCEKNAVAEGVRDRTIFVKGNALKLSFPDEHFDAVTSNYCYHNISVKDRKDLILETLRTLKKGGTFAIHDEFTKSKYGDTSLLVKKLKDLGYERVELIDTTEGLFMTAKEAGPLGLKGSCLLVGKK